MPWCRVARLILTDLGVGPQDVIALLLPNLFEMPLLLWSVKAAGIICPINLDLPPNQVVALLKSPLHDQDLCPTLDAPGSYGVCYMRDYHAGNHWQGCTGRCLTNVVI